MRNLMSIPSCWTGTQDFSPSSLFLPRQRRHPPPSPGRRLRLLPGRAPLPPAWPLLPSRRRQLHSLAVRSHSVHFCCTAKLTALRHHTYVQSKSLPMAASVSLRRRIANALAVYIRLTFPNSLYHNTPETAVSTTAISNLTSFRISSIANQNDRS